MPSTSDKTSINEFLSVLAGGREVGLVIAKSNAEVSSFTKAMDNFDFNRSNNIADLFKSPKTYFVADGNLNKDVYDFVVQYPTGQVEIFDKKLMQSRTLSPNYKNSSIVLVVAKGDINKIQESGFDILSFTGPAFQS